MEFADWLVREMNNRGWGNSELARRAGVAPSTVSMILSDQKGPGIEFCVKVAKAFEMPPEVVLRESGLLPARPARSQRGDRLLYHFDQLGDIDQELAIDLLRTMAESRGIYDVSGGRRGIRDKG